MQVAIWKEGNEYTSRGFKSRKELNAFVDKYPQVLALTPRESKGLQARYVGACRNLNDDRALREFEEMFQEFCAKKFVAHNLEIIRRS